MYVDCFTLLTAPVKIRILLGMLHLTSERLDRLEDHFRQLIDYALADSDPWVKVTAGLLKYYLRRYSQTKQPAPAQHTHHLVNNFSWPTVAYCL